MMKRIVLASALALAMGCSGDDNNTSNNANNSSGGIEAGQYVVTVENVTDGCFDGAMDTIVLPDGMPRDLPAPVTLPGQADLPAKIDIQFNDPFDDVTGIDVEASGDNGLTTSGDGFPQTGVDISSAADGSCLADMTVTFTITASADGNLSGSGALSITGTDGGDGCPAFSGEFPCSVTSDLTAVKQ